MTREASSEAMRRIGLSLKSWRAMGGVTAEELAVCEGCADLVFYGNCLHDFADQADALRNAMTALKPS